MTTNALINRIKESNTDYEFYPTTQNMVDMIAIDMVNHGIRRENINSILDIGCGNGNRHVKFNKDFMKKLNIEMARINGWIRDKSDVVSEMGMTESEVNQFWCSNKKIELTSSIKLLGLPESA